MTHFLHGRTVYRYEIRLVRLCWLFLQLQIRRHVHGPRVLHQYNQIRRNLHFVPRRVNQGIAHLGSALAHTRRHASDTRLLGRAEFSQRRYFQHHRGEQSQANTPRVAQLRRAY